MQTTTLGQITNIKTGKLDANAKIEGGKYPFFTCSKEISWIDGPSYDCECVLVAGNGDLNVKYYKGKFDAYQRTYIIESNGKMDLDMKYLYYFIEGYMETLRGQTIGGVIQYIKMNNLTDISIPLPPLATQRAIADKLDKLQFLIDLKKQAIAKTDELAKSIFLDMFGDPMKNEKGREIVEIRKLIFETENVNPLKNPDEEYNYIDISAVDNISKEIVRYKTFHGKEAPSRARQVVYKNDILISTVRPNLNAVAVVKNNLTNYLCSTGFCILRCGEKIVHNYLFEIVKSDFFIDNMVKVAKGASYPAISDNNVKDFRIPLPPLPLQQKFADIITQIEVQKSEHKLALAKLEELYQAEMQKSFSL